MIYRIVYIALLASLGGCSSPKSQGELVVLESILAHGGLNNYASLQDFRYEKTSYTLDAQEVINDTLVQQFEIPRLGTTILITEDSLRITLQNENIQTSKELNSSQQNYKSIIEGANFVFFQPFKLKDKGAQIEYLGLKSPGFSEEPLEQIRVTYPNSSDIWYFFFDHETKYVLANAVDHNRKVSLILNDSLQWHKNLLVHSRRRSFLSNSNFELIRLQASYKYKMLSVE
ncbi:MAG: hypothetical protein VW010_03325 [Flavobacteriaceae bacterium]